MEMPGKFKPNLQPFSCQRRCQLPYGDLCSLFLSSPMVPSPGAFLAQRPQRQVPLCCSGRSCFCLETWGSHFLTSLSLLASLCPAYMDSMALRAVAALLLSFWEGWQQGRLSAYTLIPRTAADNHISSIVIAAIMGK